MTNSTDEVHKTLQMTIRTVAVAQTKTMSTTMIVMMMTWTTTKEQRGGGE